MYAIVLALWAIYEKTEDIMGRVVKNEKELVQAIQNNVDYIEVECGIKRMSGMFFDFKRCGNLVP